MVSDQIYVSNDGSGMQEALALADRFAAYYQLSPRDCMHLRLLSEEAMVMVRMIAGNYRALFWLEGSENQCRIVLEFRTEMDVEKRKELIAVSTSKKNDAAQGVLGKIREIIEVGFLDYEEADQMVMNYGGDPYSYWSMGIDPQNAAAQSMLNWSLNTYRNSLDEMKENGRQVEEVWDELEKSIVANLADDVRVAIRQDKVDMTILKEFGKGGKK